MAVAESGAAGTDSRRADVAVWFDGTGDCGGENDQICAGNERWKTGVGVYAARVQL